MSEADRQPERGEREQASLDAEAIAAALPGMARVAAGAWLRTVQWGFETGVRVGARAARSAAAGEPPTAVADELGRALGDGARAVLGINDLGGWLREQLGVEPERPQIPQRTGEEAEAARLREKGAELLRRSATVGQTEEAHPAYTRILEAIAPDEARILRHMMRDGPQPAVDVRTWRPFDLGSRLIAQGISMLGAEAGCRHPERLPSYLNNLFRLGMIWFSREPLDDLPRYTVLEAQPAVHEAQEEAGRARIVRRSVRLTPFGIDFCRVCLTPEISYPGEPTGHVENHSDGAQSPTDEATRAEGPDAT